MEQLHELAGELRVHIEYANIGHLGRAGDYHAPSRIIRLALGMTHRKERSVLAHELGHALHKDVPSIFNRYTQRQEDRADEWAAHFLIGHDDYRLAEEKYGTHTKWIAQELYVLERLVTAYERTLHRIGDTIYVKPNLGIAQQKLRA